MSDENVDETLAEFYPGDGNYAPRVGLRQAIESGDARHTSRALAQMTFDDRRRRLMEGYSVPVVEHVSTMPRIMIPLFHAAHCGKLAVFMAVFGALQSSLASNEIAAMLTSAPDAGGKNLLITAIAGGNVDVVRTVLKFLDEHDVAMDQKARMLKGVLGQSETAIMVAASTGNEEMVQVVARLIMDDWVHFDEEVRQDPTRAMIVAERTDRGWTALTFAVETRMTAIVDAIVSLVERTVPADQAQQKVELKHLRVNLLIEKSLQVAVSNVLESSDRVAQTKALDVISALLKHGVWPSGRQLSQISHEAGFEPAKKCFLDAVCLAVNPLLVGMILSLQLSGAAGSGNEGQRQKSIRLQQEVENLVLEIFERLPKTVDGFEEDGNKQGGMQACSMVFTPEKVHESDQPGGFQLEDGENTRVKMGPLKIAQQARHQLELFCTQPLVLDFMSRKFSSLPAVGATDRELLEAGEVQNFRREMLSVQDHPGENPHDLSNELFAVLAGLHPIFGSMTFLPGAQFILSELVTKPTFCYSVPAVRMVMHLLAYLSMLILFGCDVLLFHEDVRAGEVIFFIYTLGAILIEIMELWDGREEYMRDHWNILDVLALGFCLTAFLVRVSDPDSLWGRALYCIGAPLLLFRALFFAQFFPAQGPMIEIIFNLAGEVARFGTIMLVVLIGFALSFYALFRHSCTVSAFRNYWATSISLLRLMLGETVLFDDFTIEVECCDENATSSDELHCEDFLMECCHRVHDEHFNGIVGKVLLVAYLVVMGIILLNLLIAVLSEAYVDVKENIDVESKVSRTLVIQHYIKEVENDHLPSPLNLVQYSFALLAMTVGWMTNARGVFRRAEFFAGLILFWLISGVFAISVGSALWIISWPKVLSVFWGRRSSAGVFGSPVVIQIAVLLSGISMPLTLFYKWIWATATGSLLQHLAGAWANVSGREYSEIGGGDERNHDDGIVGRALKLGPGGLNVYQLREFLANPMNDPVVQRDEEDRATTVEHLKLLRDLLLKKMEAASQEQAFAMTRVKEQVEAMVGEVVSARDADSAAEIKDLRAQLEITVGAIVDARVKALSDKVDGLDSTLSEIVRALDPDR